ncbi:MAG: TspO/MBR family protein [Chloroflexota bacterium]
MGNKSTARIAADGVRTAAIAAITVATAGVGGVSGDFNSSWYRSLRKPRWQPAGSVIGAVWSLLYTLIAVALALLFRSEAARRDRGLLALAGAQYLLNVAFTPLLTRARSLSLATLDCAMLAAVVTALTRWAWPRHRLAATLLVPYALWTSFATLLSLRLKLLNPELEARDRV